MSTHTVVNVIKTCQSTSFPALKKNPPFLPAPTFQLLMSDDGDVEDAGGVICDAGDVVGDDGDGDAVGDGDYNDAEAEASCFPTSPPLLANC